MLQITQVMIVHDCFGTPNGDAWVSDCGCVSSDNSGDDCDDCAGTPNGRCLCR